MSRAHVPRALREIVARAARYRCGYCLTQEAVIGMAMEIEHILPRALGGVTEEQNLWLACAPCNNAKRDRIAALDYKTAEVVRLFDPRRQRWAAHFAWSADRARIFPRTPIGRATVIALDLNRPALVNARRAWTSVGWHPPRDES